MYLQARTLQQEREIEALEAKVGQLETVRQRQASKLSGLKENLNETLNEFETKKSQTHTTIQALSSELRTTKQSLEEVVKREKAVSGWNFVTLETFMLSCYINKISAEMV